MPLRTATWATITSLGKTPFGTGTVTWSLAADVLPVAILRKAIGPFGEVAVLMNLFKTLRVICLVAALTLDGVGLHGLM